ncbi:uncharacterized protein LOC119768771 isoform X1 [Culex quinquefasciatus]|uniref:uncharacterized protein LOC119768771 isoform X1 n=1 Tax=Culex quinquefasciatus TaxID=7176 RepID=UPI0018E3E3DF|nr:uncharacterized protein LOC119768771 isoform X1 [Culex quinquefasciatus]
MFCRRKKSCPPDNRNRALPASNDALEEIIDHSALFGRPDARQDKVNDQLFKASYQKRFLLADAFNNSVHVNREMPRWIPKFGTCLLPPFPPSTRRPARNVSSCRLVSSM